MTNGEMLDDLDAAGYVLETIEKTHETLMAVKVTFAVRGTMDDTKEFKDWNWVSCVVTAHSQLVPRLNDPSLGDERVVFVNGVRYHKAE